MKLFKFTNKNPLIEKQKLQVDNNMLRQEVASLKKQLKLYSVVKSLPRSEYIWVQARSESDRRVFIKWFEQYR